MAATYTLTDEVRAVLKTVTITGTWVSLPQPLPRTLSTAVSKVLARAGGTWDSKAQAHVFPRDPEPLIQAAIATGQVTNRTPTYPALYTPQALAETLVRVHMAIRPGDSVLEPSAGHGALALAAAQYTSRHQVLCYEINPKAVDVLKGHGFPTMYQDFLTTTTRRRFDHILMHPPCTEGQDIEHVLYALNFLKRGGRLFAITSAMAGVSTTRAQLYFRATMQALGAERFPLPADAFAATGMRVQTALWLLTMPASAAESPEETPATPPTHPVDALDARHRAASDGVEASLGRADVPEGLHEDCTPAVAVGIPTQPLTAQLASCDLPWPAVPRCTHEVSAGRCPHQARYQVHATFCTRTWHAVQVTEHPRYCRQHAEERARHYTHAASTRR
jgi:predicted RNA methylase